MTVVEILNDFAAGWTSGVAGLFISHPLDTIKVRLQSMNAYKSAFHCVSRTMKEESMRGFYKGMAVPLLTAGFLHSTFFVGYSATLAAIEKFATTSMIGKRSREQQRKENPLRVLLLASVVGAALQWIPSCPIEIVKTKLQVQQENYRQLLRLQNPIPISPIAMSSQPQRLLFAGPVDCVRQTIAHVGVRGFYRGGLTMLLRDVIGFCFYLPVYELTLRRLTKNSSGTVGNDRVWAPMLAGGVAGVACWWSILPLDVVKSRLQADDLKKPKFDGLLDCVRQTYAKDGLKAFVKGWHVSALRGFPACACLFLVYEQTIRILVEEEKSFK